MARAGDMQGPNCKHCEMPESRCAWVQGCCPKCSHFRYMKPAVEEPKPATVVRVVRVPSEVPPPPHALDMDDPLDKLYLELLPVRPDPFRIAAPAYLLAELVDEVCPRHEIEAVA